MNRFTSSVSDAPLTRRVLLARATAVVAAVALPGWTRGTDAWAKPLIGASTARPEDFGAVGDGVTDDSAAITQAVNAAGPAGTVIFRSGAIYLTSGALVPLAGQSWIGQGSALKRCAAVATTTTGAVTAGHFPTTVPVASTAGFRVGMQVTLFADQTTFEPANHRILAMDNGALVVDSPFRLAWPAGTHLVSSFDFVQTDAANLTIDGLTFLGNRANNAALVRWELQAAVRSSGDGMTIKNCKVQDTPADGFVVGGKGLQLLGNTMQDLGGNGIHLSGASNYIVDKNAIVNANLAGLTPGHADGCVSFSNDTTHGTLTNNTFVNGLSGFGGISSADNSFVTMRHNVVKNCRRVLVIESLGLLEASIVFSDNTCSNSGEVTVRNLNGSLQPGVGPRGITVERNQFTDCNCAIVGAGNVVLAANVWRRSRPSAANDYYVLVTNSDRVRIQDTFIGSSNGVVVTGSQSAHVVIGGTFRDNRLQAIQFAPGVQPSCSVVRAKIIAGHVSKTYIAVRLANGTSLQETSIAMSSGHWGVECPPRGARVIGNHIVTPRGTPSVELHGGSSANIVRGNYLAQPIDDQGIGNHIGRNSGPGAKR